uniref:Photosynthetic NDH subcomplex B 4 n=1 Tax=Pelargonium echinatum TaxID=122254 RepID=A0A0F7GXX0_9ROSI
MAEATMGFTTIIKPSFASPRLYLRQVSSSFLKHQVSGLGVACKSKSKSKSARGSSVKVKAFPDWPLMALLLEQMEDQKDIITNKSIVHLSDETIKNVYLFYIMFTVWGCMVFGSTKDPYYDSEYYRGDGGDGTGHCFYEKQENIEEAARAALWREELIEEIEQKVEGSRELEKAGRK